MNDAWLYYAPRDGLAQLVDEVDLDPDSRERVAAVIARLAELRDTFIAHVASSTADVLAHVVDPSELSGLSEREHERARTRAKARGVEGYLLAIEEPCFEAAQRTLNDRALRKQLFEARFTRASSRGPRAGRFDNTAIFTEMLALRHELAHLLGYRNYAELALRHDVFRNPDDAESYLLTAHRSTRASAQKELDALWAFAKEKGVPRGFSNWDLDYYADWMIRAELGFDAESLSPYFNLPAVIAGLCSSSERLFGLRVTPTQPQVDGYSTPHVYPVTDANGTALGELELLAFSGPGELHGCQATLSHERGRVPRLRLRVGLEAPCEGEPPMLTHARVEALFRCAGRGLALLAAGDLSKLAVARQHEAALTAQLAGGLLAQSCADYDSVASFARHHGSGEVVPKASFEVQLEARRRHAHLRAAQALELALFDLRIHRDYVPDSVGTHLRDQVLDTFTQVRREQSVLPMPYWTRLANTCLPLFADDEAARLWHETWVAQVAAKVFEVAREARFSETCLGRLRNALWFDLHSPLSERLSEALGSSWREANPR